MSNLPVVFLILASAVLSAELAIATPILEIIAGIIGANLFGLEVGPGLDYISNLGFLTLMFLAGLELDLHKLKANLKEATILGGASFFVPFMPLAALVHWYTGNPLVALFVATGLSTTSVAIVYPILKDAHFLSFPKGQVIFAATVILDLLTMVVLSLLVFEFTTTTLFVIPALIAVLLVVPDISRHLFARYKDKSAEVELRSLLLLILGESALAEYGHIHVALATFFLGAFVSEALSHHEELETKLRSLAFGFLTPVFFYSVGASINLATVASHLPEAVILFALSFALKFIGSYYPTKKILPDHGTYVGFLFNNQLTLGIVAATIGREAGAIDPATYMILVSVIVASSIASSFAIGRKKCGLDMICE